MQVLSALGVSCPGGTVPQVPRVAHTHMHSLSVLLVHFIDEDETRYLVLVSLPPHGHALGLCTEQTRLGSVSARDGNYVGTYVGFFVLLIEFCGSDDSQFCMFVCACFCVYVRAHACVCMCVCTLYS